MCTIGAVATSDSEGNPVAFALKTSDYMQVGHWHGCITGGAGNDFMGFNTASRPGVNSGMNEKGLAVIRSFLDYRGPFDEKDEPAKEQKDFPLDVDRRSAIAASLLERYETVDETLPYLHDVIPRHTGEGTGQRGGNFLLADATGEVAVLEHCEDRIESRVYAEGFSARGNNGRLILLDEQARLPGHVREDRETRCDYMQNTLEMLHESIPRGMSKDEALDALKETLSWKGPEGDGGVGSICALNLRAPGARTNSAQPCSTRTAVIFDLIEKTMHFTRGNPNTFPWETMRFPA